MKCSHPKLVRRSLYAALLAAGLTQSPAFAQSTTGSIFGTAPAEPDISVVATSASGLSRAIAVDANGRYNISTLPVGIYSVELRRGEQVIERRENITLRVGSSTEISFKYSATTLGTVTVTAASVPKIDVSSTSARTVITSEQLDVLPLGRSAEAIALLSPGAVSGSGAFSNGTRSTVSFGGAGVTENAYYINGFSTGNPLSNLGGVSLPYGSIEQQETFTGGYSAKYGRSTGGVINQIGKRGTNEWEFGFQATWAPKSLRSSPGDRYYPSRSIPSDYSYEHEDYPGTLYRYRQDDGSTTTTYSAYVGGPLIEDKLFMFVSAESEKTDGISTQNIESTPYREHYSESSPKFYAKIDWNINENNLLEYSRVENTDRYGGYYTEFDYDTLNAGERTGTYPNTTKLKDKYDIFKFTSYLTDDLTLTAEWGRNHQDNIQYNPVTSDLPYLTGTNNQDPSITGGTRITNDQTTGSAKDPDAGSKTRGLRMALEYRIGDHELTAGIDNMYYNAYNEGQSMSGPGYRWTYARGDADEPINETLGVGAPGGDGYYVRKYIYVTTTDMAVEQKAYYLEDRWQVNDKWLLTLGVRNDKFRNFNSDHVAYVDSGDQWAPRAGVSWDVFGDSSFKLFANLGRYYLALPNSVAIRGASASTYTNEYFTYTGIDANGEPTGLTALGPGPVSSNGEYGQAPDPNSFAPSDLESQYQDELILGFEKTIGEKWNSGAKFTYRKLQSAIDDVCDTGRMADKLEAGGIDSSLVNIPGCVMFNPGETNTYHLAYTDGSGYATIDMSQQDWGFTDKARRNYLAVDLFLEHPFDGTWYGRIDYTWSHSYGNTEGQVKSDIGQADVSKTQDWDSTELMEYAGGDLANDRRHQIKAYGAYQITPEWMASATVRIQSGTPKSCLGYYGTDESDPLGYGSSYRYCGGTAVNPGGAGRTPWTKRLDLGLTYRPTYFDHKLAFGMQIFNVFNDRNPIQTDTTYNSGKYIVSDTYGIGTYYTEPRYLKFSVSYDY